MEVADNNEEAPFLKSVKRLISFFVTYVSVEKILFFAIFAFLCFYLTPQQK